MDSAAFHFDTSRDVSIEFDGKGLKSGTGAGGNEVFGNQAVLGALNSLQQKIKRLEQERDYYIDAAQKARQHVEAYKTEMEQLRSTEKRQYDDRDRLREEDMRKMKEEQPRLEMEMAHVAERARHTERLLEAERKDFEHRLKDTQRQRDDLQAQNVALQAQVTDVLRLKETAEAEGGQTKQTVANLVELNEMIYEKLLELQQGSVAPAQQLPAQHVRPALAASSRPQQRSARSSAARTSRRGRSESAGHYVDPARQTMSSQKRRISPKRSSTPLPPPGHNVGAQGVLVPTVHEQLKRMHNGDLPFMPAGKTGGNDTFNQTARVQRTLDVSVKEAKASSSRRSCSKAEHSPMLENVYLKFVQEYETMNAKYREELEKLRTGGDVGIRAVERMRELAEEMAERSRELKAMQEHEHGLGVHRHVEVDNGPRPHVKGLDKRVKVLELFEEMRRVHGRVGS
eukprot:Rhum_TRINITY_DN4357_c0_g1::Rhum_TRINITY_DN4357_c0_g1_i1::g.14040::m.14040